MPEGTQFGNKAEIYFDTNPPIITNTAFTTLETYIPQAIPASYPVFQLHLFPNPTDDMLRIYVDRDADFYICGSLGERYLMGRLTVGENRLTVGNIPVGQYWLVVQAEGRQMSQPLTIVR